MQNSYEFSQFILIQKKRNFGTDIKAFLIKKILRLIKKINQEYSVIH